MLRKLKRLIRRRKKNETVLTPLEQLQNASRSAVFMITSTITELRGINEAIEREQETNRTRIAEIEETNNSLEKTKTDNAKVVSNFESLLR
ncbi:MAG: hypothetical protein J6S14_15380 [Clostridia bacterium]|nr:hypothetical protein [Clostridia bacterium]